MTHTQITDLITYDNFLDKYKVEKQFTRTILGDSLIYKLKNILLVKFNIIELEKELGITYNPNEYNDPKIYLTLRNYYFNLMKERFGDINVAYLDNDITGRYFSQTPNSYYFEFNELVASEEAYKKIVEFYTK